MPTREEKLIQAARKYLKAKGEKPTAEKILKLLQDRNVPTEEIAKNVDPGALFREYHAEHARRNILRRMHPRILAVAKKAVEYWDRGSKVDGKYVVEIPFHEILVEELRYRKQWAAAIRADTALSVLSALTGAEASVGYGHIRLEAPLENVENVRKNLEEVAELYEKMLVRSDGKKTLLERAFEAIGLRPNMQNMDDLVSAIEHVEEALMDPEKKEKLKRELKRDEIDIIKKMLDPRYLTQSHVAHLAHISRSKERTVVASRKDLEHYYELLEKVGFTGGMASSYLRPKHMTAVSGDVKKQDPYVVYVDANPALARALLEHLAKKNPKIRRFVRKALEGD